MTKPRTPKTKLNRDEQRYADTLNQRKQSGDITNWMYEPIKFVLAPRTTYTPDFLIITRDGIEFVEVKGFLRDDAAVKFKVAAKLHSWARWLMIRWRKGRWETIYDL